MGTKYRISITRRQRDLFQEADRFVYITDVYDTPPGDILESFVRGAAIDLDFFHVEIQAI